MGPRLQISANAVEPGSLTLRVNGVAVDEFDTWTYTSDTAAIWPDQLSEYGLHLHADQRVTLTVVAKRFTDPAWVVAVAPRP